MKTIAHSLLFILSAGLSAGLAATGCGPETATESYPMKSQADLVLSSANHPHGFTQSQCFNCHVKQDIHQLDHLGLGSLPVAIALTNSLGLGACASCHGKNGVVP